MRGSATSKKILGFDNWTRGSHHYVRLVEAFAERQMTLQLVHLGSWGNDSGRSPIERIESLPVRDISSYDGGSFERVLEVEKPDAIIFLSTMTFAHRAFIRYCRARGVPTMNLYHGMSTTWFDLGAKEGFRASPLGHARFVIGRLVKTVRNTIPCYVRALVKTGAPSPDWRRFGADLVMMFFGRHILVASDDARTDICAVYTESEVEHALYTYGFSREDVHVVGNPDLVRFGLTREHLGWQLRNDAAASRDVMYVDTALQANAMLFPTAAAFAAHLREVAEAMQRNGLRLLLKLHPANDMARIRALLANSNAEFVGNAEFVRKLLPCRAAIVETTTLAIIPALVGMPVLFANFGALRDLKFGSALTSYPRGRFLRNLNEFEQELGHAMDLHDKSAVEEWISKSSGPLPAEDMPARVAALLTALIREGVSKDAERDRAEEVRAHTEI